MHVRQMDDVLVDRPFSDGGRRFSVSGGAWRASGITIAGARSSASITSSVAARFISLVCPRSA
jgi:hypothetical protein